ncbi:MAG: oligomeric golgi complex component, COG2-domain-containing protein [Benjaminiella poitrasii]|nr:MAG: oligomeric golgi complex component, COG2-domain-containing protein [Benjaminiella poitrasii]
MKTELNAHLKQLKAELVELINRDYQDFINLSTNLKGVDRNIKSLKSPLDDMEIQVIEVRNHYQKVIDELEMQLQGRAQLRDKKSVLNLLLNIHNSVTKVEDLLGINTDTVKNELNAVERDAVVVIDDKLGKEIERVAIEYNQMQHLVRRGEDLDFVTENEWRITRIRDTMEHKLSKALSAALSQIRLGEVTRATKQSLTQCLRTYAMIGQSQTAERMIREEFIKPFIMKTITQKAAEGTRDYTVEQEKCPLSIMYSKILTFVTTDLKPILDITQKKLKSSNYEVLVNSLWVEITERINKECKSIFAAGQTDIFHKNYSATIDFMTGLESLYSTKKSILYFRNHPTYIEFMKRWQLPVYFQLRFHEIVKEIENSLDSSKLEYVIYTLYVRTHKKKDEIIFPEGKAIIKAISKCWSDQVFLYGLSHRFWKLTLQLIKRYQGWFQDSILKIESSKTIEETTNFLTILAHDIKILIKDIKLQMNESIFPKLPLNLQDLPIVKDTIEEMLNQLKETTESAISEKND